MRGRNSGGGNLLESLVREVVWWLRCYMGVARLAPSGLIFGSLQSLTTMTCRNLLQAYERASKVSGMGFFDLELVDM